MIVPNFRKANFIGLKNALKSTNNSNNPTQSGHLSTDQNIQSRGQVSTESVNVAYNSFITALQEKQNEYIPKRKLRSNTNQPGWMTYKLLDLIG